MRASEIIHLQFLHHLYHRFPQSSVSISNGSSNFHRHGSGMKPLRILLYLFCAPSTQVLARALSWSRSSTWPCSSSASGSSNRLFATAVFLACIGSPFKLTPNSESSHRSMALSNVRFSTVTWICNARTATVKVATLQLSHHRFSTEYHAV